MLDNVHLDADDTAMILGLPSFAMQALKHCCATG
jgi:hypothetical protein